jgi:mannose-1-phosphate guanylyltransferase
MLFQTNQGNPKRLHAIILAGGDGTRLRALTSKISGDNRPKQFCPLLGVKRFSSRLASE